MRDMTSNPAPPTLARAFGPALAILLLTSVHHAYGAYVYDTPWRLHAAIVAGLVVIALWGMTFMHRSRPAGPARTAAAVAFCVVDFIVPVAGIGLFEGGYNHVLKNLLYFGGAAPLLMSRLFPPPAYELPNDLFFEGTGCMQLVVGLFAAYRLHAYIRHEMYWRYLRSIGPLDGGNAEPPR
jgi:hypothetical protein